MVVSEGEVEVWDIIICLEVYILLEKEREKERERERWKVIDFFMFFLLKILSLERLTCRNDFSWVILVLLSLIKFITFCIIDVRKYHTTIICYFQFQGGIHAASHLILICNVLLLLYYWHIDTYCIGDLDNAIDYIHM